MIGVGEFEMLRNLGVWNGVVCAALLFLPASSSTILFAQSVISAKSGVVHYIEGQVKLDGELIQPKFGQFPEVKNGQVLSTTEGRAEVLLTPGVFLRMAEDSSFRMLSNSLADTRISLLYGSALVEVVELLENNAVTAEVHDAQISLPKRGIYRIDADGSTLRVYDGEARLNQETGALKVKKGREVELGADKPEAKNFDAKETDPFYRWSARRATYIAAANVTAARTAARSGYYSSGFVGRSYGSWAWNPFFGMYTFMPSSGIFMSPFGAPFYSPSAIFGVSMPMGRPMTPMPMPVNPAGGISGPPSVGAGQMRPFGGTNGMRGAGGAVAISPGGGGMRGR